MLIKAITIFLPRITIFKLDPLLATIVLANVVIARGSWKSLITIVASPLVGNMHKACFIIPIPKLVLGFIANL